MIFPNRFHWHPVLPPYTLVALLFDAESFSFLQTYSTFWVPLLKMRFVFWFFAPTVSVVSPLPAAVGFPRVDGDFAVVLHL